MHGGPEGELILNKGKLSKFENYLAPGSTWTVVLQSNVC